MTLEEELQEARVIIIAWKDMDLERFKALRELTYQGKAEWSVDFADGEVHFIAKMI